MVLLHPNACAHGEATISAIKEKAFEVLWEYFELLGASLQAAQRLHHRASLVENTEPRRPTPVIPPRNTKTPCAGCSLIEKFEWFVDLL